MTAVRYDLTIEKGAQLALVFRCLDSDGNVRDLSDYSARFTVRETNVTGDIVEGYDSTTGDSPDLATIDGEAGEVSLTLPASLTSTSPAAGCRGWYTLKIWPADDEEAAERIAEGVVVWAAESSRDDVSGA